jgi:prolyl-tRNA synthetase
LEDAKKLLEKHGGIIRVAWCGQDSCGKNVEEATGGAVLGEELDGAPLPASTCIVCSKKAKCSALVAKAY